MADQHEHQPVFADERRRRIAEIVGVRGRARIGELAEMLDVSEPTVRKDLTTLHEQGILKRTHGGAIATTKPLAERELSAREADHREAKVAIGRACLRLLRDGDSVFLDNGTTVGALAAALAATPLATSRNLVVLTSSVAVATALADLPTVEHVLLGGQLRRASGSIVGALALSELRRYSVGVAIVGASGLAEGGISVASAAEAEIKAAVIERAARVVVALDHSKVGVSDFARICELDAIDTLVIDEAGAELRELCARHAIEVIVAGAGGGV